MTGLARSTDYKKSSIACKISGLLENLIIMIGFFFSLIISDRLISNSFFGGALFSGSRIIHSYIGIFSRKNAILLSKQEIKKYILWAPVVTIALICLLVVYPFLLRKTDIFPLVLFILFQFIKFYLLDSSAPGFARPGKTGRYRYPYFLAALMPLFLAWLVFPDNYIVIWVYCFIDFLLLAAHQFLTRVLPDAVSPGAEPDFSPQEIGGMMKVNSYKFYWRMTANTKIAFEVSILIAVCYLPYLPFKGFWPLMADVAALIGSYCLAAAISKFIINKKRFRELGKNTVFILFSVVWILASYYLYNNYDRLTGLHFYISFLLLCICITVLASVLFSMESDLQIIGILGVAHFTAHKFEILKAMMNRLSTFFSQLVIMFINCFLTFFTELNQYRDEGIVYILGKYGFTILPALFLLFGVLTAVRQPLTLLYEQKLKKYITLKKEGKINKPLEEKLRRVLVYKYRKRIGIRLLMILIKPFFLHKARGKENVNPRDFPSVFVCNHSQIYGPVAAILNMPFYVKPWILDEMIDNEKIAAHIQHGTFDRQKWLPKFLRDRAGKIVGPLVAWAMQSTEPIPVYRNEGRDVLRGISMSVDALEADDNILLFPENPFRSDGYVTEGVGEFFTGFVNIARDYYKRTGRALTFYSVFANKWKRTLSFSKGITFDPNAPFRDEKARIAEYLHDRMVELSEK